MSKPLKDRLKESMKIKGVKVPGLSAQTGIPKDRIYAWYRDNTSPKAEDQERLERWLNGETFILDNGNRETSDNQLITQNSTPKPSLLEALVMEMTSLSRLTHKILQEQKEEVVDKIKRIDANLDVVVAQTEKIDIELESGRLIVLQALSRLENKSVDQLVREADNLKIELAKVKDGLYNSLEGKQSTGTRK